MVFIEHNSLKSNIFLIPYLLCFSGFMFFWVQIFQDPGFSESRFFRVQVLEKYFLANKSYLIDTRDRKLTNTQLSSSFAIRRNFRSKMKSYIKKIQMYWISDQTNSADNYLFKVNNKNSRTRCGVCSKLTIKIPERRQ